MATPVAWRVEEERLVGCRSLNGANDKVRAVAKLEHDLAVSAGADSWLRLWDLLSGTERLQVGEPLGASWGVCSVGASHIAAASPIGVVRIAAAGDLSV